MYKCRFCGREFNHSFSCVNHEKHYCSKNPDKIEPATYRVHKTATCPICGKSFDVANIERHKAACGKAKIDNQVHLDHDGLICKYCGKLCKNRNSLAQHEIRCPQNPDRKDFSTLNSFVQAQLKGKTKETSIYVAKAASTLREHYKTGKVKSYNVGKPGTFKGRHHTEESKEKTRLSTIKYLENTVDNFHVRYNVNACKYIDALNEKMGWHLQHAENGGEIGIGGYFIDGYDKDLNIAFEYDEPKHYKDINNNVLIDSDIERMNFIINKLNCKFFRYNEKLDLFYEVISDK